MDQGLEKWHSPRAQMLGVGEVKVAELQGAFVCPSETRTVSVVGWRGLGYVCGRTVTAGLWVRGGGARSRLAATLVRPVVVEAGSEDAWGVSGG